MNKLITKIVVISALAVPLAFAAQALAATISVGNASTSRANADSYSNFTIIDTNNPVSADGTLGTFSYFATSTSPFEFVLVDSGNTVQWVSPTITPAATGTNTWTPVSPISVSAGWNLGVHFDATGTIPFDFGGASASYTANGSGMPVASSTLTIAGTSGRTYSFGATGDVTVASTTIATTTVNTVIQDGNNNATTSALVGTAVHDSVTVVANSPATTTPTGTVDITSYIGTGCTGESSVQPNVPLVNGSAFSSTTTVPANGLSYMVFYDGQAGVYSQVNGACESLTAASATGTTTGTTSGSISGTVYEDANHNGIKDAGEAGLPGWTINLYTGANWPTQKTTGPQAHVVSDASGNFVFSNLADGTYSLEEVDPPGGLKQISPDYPSIVIINGAAITGEDFRDATTTSLNGGSGNKCGDHDGDVDDRGCDNGGNHGGQGNQGNHGGQGGQGGYGNGGNQGDHGWGSQGNNGNQGNGGGKGDSHGK